MRLHAYHPTIYELFISNFAAVHPLLSIEHTKAIRKISFSIHRSIEPTILPINICFNSLANEVVRNIVNFGKTTRHILGHLYEWSVPRNCYAVSSPAEIGHGELVNQLQAR